jgi:GrpB-like predicted nucleotidyltransferase (UPF0157 family)/GNAT superfamily N-acetyltransferase
MKKHIEVVSYNPEWPLMFEAEAKNIREILGDNCVAIHHIGSTSVKGLTAKPVIDIIMEVKDREKTIISLESLGYLYKGEYNIPMRLYFNKKKPIDVNLHVYEEDHPEIELNLLFRDYLRDHHESMNAYAFLKTELLKNPSSFEKNKASFTGYNLGKDDFIRTILKQAGFNRIRFMRCMHHTEIETAKLFRQKYFFDKIPIEDPYLWTFDHKDNVHFVLYKGVDIIGYAHIQFWPDAKAALRIIVIDEIHRHKGYGSEFLILIEKWLKQQNIKILHIESSPEAYPFYCKHHYNKMPFTDPENHEDSIQEMCSNDIAIGKKF